MKEFDIIRDYKSQATLGKLINPNSKSGYPPICYTLERPRIYKGIFNRKDDPKTDINESCCFPEGKYVVEWTFSPRFARYMYLINVEGWEGLRMHPANNVDDLTGCIVPCLRILENIKYKGKLYRYWADYGKYTGKAKNFMKEVIEDRFPKKFILNIKSMESINVGNNKENISQNI